jgi:hypothetical protein
MKGDDLKALQEKVKGPLGGVDAVFAAAETGKLGLFIETMVKTTRPLSDSLRKRGFETLHANTPCIGVP